VVEDCVNAVGVDVNTASAPCSHAFSGIGAGLAQNIVLHRDANGAFRSRKALKDVRAWGRRHSSNAPAFCAFRAARTRSMRRACTRKPIRWSGGFIRRPTPTSKV